MIKAIKLKISALMLFWFGAVLQFIMIMGGITQYRLYGDIEELIGFSHPLLAVVNFSWTYGAHIMHMVAGYWLAKGLKKGFVFGIIVGGWETIGFLVLFQDTLLIPAGFAIRILFVIVLLLIILGRKELDYLKHDKWRPWYRTLRFA